ncbi:DMT family transporter [Aestuariivirga sp.]|uniref:DMT family transporter n=1 Tax=Aestuariivirga sp. TaxID=2650926 RepID=UPI0039E6DE6C
MTSEAPDLHPDQVKPAAPVLQDNRVRGILYMMATMVCFISLDTIMKYSLEHYSLVQVTWARFFFASVFAALICGRRLPELARSSVPGVQLTRTVLLMTTTGLFNAGVSRLPLATATTIMFLTPIIVTMMSIAVLGEKVGLRRWLGIAVGFMGALIVVRPWESLEASFATGVLFLLAAAFTNASYQIATRQVRFDDPLTSLLFTAAGGALVSSILLPAHWQTPDLFGWCLMVGSGFAGALGHFFIIRAFRYAPASVVAPFSYTSLVWATLFGFLIWGQLPDTPTWIGAGFIVCAGLYIFFREREVKQRVSADDTAD